MRKISMALALTPNHWQKLLLCGLVTALIGSGSYLLYSQTKHAKAQATPEFVLGVNFGQGLNDKGVTVDGNYHRGYQEALTQGFSETSPIDGGGLWDVYNTAKIQPQFSGAVGTLLSHGIGDYRNPTYELRQTLPNGQYHFYLWHLQGWIDKAAGTVSAEGVQVGTIGGLDQYRWKRFGPYNATVNDGTLTVAITKNAGVYQMGTNAISIFKGNVPTPPAEPTNVQATTGNKSVTLSWTASPTAGVTGYNVYRQVNAYADDPMKPIKITNTPVSGTNYTDSNLFNFKDYHYFITAVTSTGGESSQTFPITARPKGTVNVRSAHPRFITPTRLTELKSYMAQNTVRWGALKFEAENGNDMVSTALAYAVSGNEQYATRAISQVKGYMGSAPNLLAAEGNGHYYGQIWGPAMVHDFIFNSPNYSAADKKQVTDWLMLQADVLPSPDRWSYKSPSNNYFWDQSALVGAALAAYGEDSRAAGHLEERLQLWYNYAVPYFQGWGKELFIEGTGYGMDDYVGLTVYGYKAATGTDLMAENGINYQETNLKWLMFQSAPNYKNQYNLGDQARGPLNGFYSRQRNKLLFQAAGINNPTLKSYAYALLEGPLKHSDTWTLEAGRVNGPNYPGWEEFLFFDESVPLANLANFEKTFVAPNAGLFTKRTGWGSTDTMWGIWGGKLMESHQWRAIGTPIIWAGGSYLLKDGAMGTSGIANETKNHNTYTFGTTNGYANEQFWSGPEAGWPLHAGEFLKGDDHGNYSYTAVRANPQAYAQDKNHGGFTVVKDFTRKFVEVDNKYFTVCDHVDLTDGNLPKDMKVFGSAPTISGRTYKWNNGGAQFFGESLLPTNVTITAGTSNSVNFINVNSTGTAKQYLLNVWEVAPMAQGSQTARRAIDTATHFGAEIDASTGGLAVLCGKSDQVNDSFVYSTSKPQTAKHIVGDVKPSTKYTITQKNSSGTTLATVSADSSDKGTLDFDPNDSAVQFALVPAGGADPTPTPEPSVAPKKANIALTKSADKSQVKENEAITYTLSYTNSGEGNAANVILTDPIPAGSTYVNGSASNSGTFRNGTLTWNIGAVNAGASGNVTFQVTANPLPPAAPPTLTVTSPTNGQSITGSTVNVTYTKGGDLTAAGVDHVHFTLDNTPEIRDLDFDGNYQFTNVPVGNHVLTGYLAKADHSKVTGTDITVTFTTAQQAAGVHLYVSPTGNDANQCTESSPCRYIRRAVDVAHAGSNASSPVTINVADGHYNEFNVSARQRTANNVLTIKAQGSGAIVDRSPTDDQDSIRINSGSSYIVIDGLKAFNSQRAGITVLESDNVTIKNGEFGNNDMWGIFSGFATNLTLENNKTYNSIGQHGIYVSNTGDNVIIRGNESYGNNFSGIQVNGDCSSNRTAADDGIISNVLMENNKVHDNKSKSLSLISMRDSIIRNNMIYNNATGGTAAAGVHFADQIDNGITCGKPSNNNVVVNNTISEPRMAGIRATNGSTANIIFNNLIISGNAFADESGGNIYDTASNISASSVGSHFVNASGNDYHLASGSSAINAGKASFNNKNAPTTDFEGTARPQGTAHDVGADER